MFYKIFKKFPNKTCVEVLFELIKVYVLGAFLFYRKFIRDYFWMENRKIYKKTYWLTRGPLFSKNYEEKASKSGKLNTFFLKNPSKMDILMQ